MSREQEERLRRVLKEAGVEFTNGNEPDVKLKAKSD